VNKRANENGAPRWRKLLIVKPTSLGDVVQSLCVPCALKRAFPDRFVGFLVSDALAELLEGHPCIDEVVPFPYRRLKSGSVFGAFRELRARLRPGGWDVAADLQGLARSGIAAWLSGAPLRVGYSDAREFSRLAYTHRIASDRLAEHAVERYMKIAAFLGADTAPVEFGLSADEEDKERFLAAAGGEPPVVLVPGARWETKRWPAPFFAELGRELHRRTGRRIVLLGSAAEAGLCAETARAIGPAALDISGRTTLSGLKAALAAAALVVSNDSGPMHLAAALGTPTVSIFGPTSPERVAPWGQERFVVRSGLDCAGCYRRKCHTMPPPCLASIEPERVFEVCMKALDGRG